MSLDVVVSGVQNAGKRSALHVAHNRMEVLAMTRYEQGFVKRAQELGLSAEEAEYLRKIKRRQILRTILKKTLMTGIGATGGYIAGNGLGNLAKTLGNNTKAIVTKDWKVYKPNVPDDFNKSLGTIGALAGGLYGVTR